MSKICRWCNLTESEKKYLLVDSRYWNVFLADKQDYIGRCILVLNRHCESLSKLKSEGWTELKSLIERLELQLLPRLVQICIIGVA